MRAQMSPDERGLALACTELRRGRRPRRARSGSLGPSKPTRDPDLRSELAVDGRPLGPVRAGDQPVALGLELADALLGAGKITEGRA